MESNQQAKFDGWAIVDVMGHQRYVGYVTTEAYGAAVLFRIDVPELGERERITKRPGHFNGHGYLPAGTTVKEGAVPGYSKLVGAGSIYTITPCTKEAALEAVEESQPRPLMSVALPLERALLGDTHETQSCPVCHSTDVPCLCDSAEDDRPYFDDEDEPDDRKCY